MPSSASFFRGIKIDMSSIERGTINISGFTFATGGMNFVTLAFIAAAATIGICIYMMNQKNPSKARTLVLISSGIGLLGTLFMLIRVQQGVSLADRLAGGRPYSLDTMISFQFGGFGAAIGFIITLIGAVNISKSNASMEEGAKDIQHEEEE